VHYFDEIVSRYYRETSHLNRYLHLFYLCDGGNWLSMLTHAGYVSPDSFLDISKGFRFGCPLRVAAGQGGATGYYIPIFIIFQGNSKFHKPLHPIFTV
jgi:hypothetical protein